MHPSFGDWNSLDFSPYLLFIKKKERERKKGKKVSLPPLKEVQASATREGGISKRRQEDVLFPQVRRWKNFMQKLCYFHPSSPYNGPYRTEELE